MSEAEPATRRRRRKSRVTATLKALIRTRITAGLITILPIVVTVWLVRILFTWMRDASLWVFEFFLQSRWGRPWLTEWGVDEKLDKIANFEGEWGFRPNDVELMKLLPSHVQWVVALISVFLTFVVLYMIGLLVANLAGRRLVELVDRVVESVPIVKTVYRGLKQVLSSLTGPQTETFRRAALVPFPQEKMRCVGFITTMFTDSVSGEELATVFIPTTPNPTTGYLQIVKRKDLIELDWSVEDAVRTIMSGGILRPDFLSVAPSATKRQELGEIRQPKSPHPSEGPTQSTGQ
jgi:uncharacterized membrane protein